MAVSGKQEAQQTIYLKWSTPKTGKVDLQYCSSVYRVTPMDVSRDASTAVSCHTAFLPGTVYVLHVVLANALVFLR